MNQVKLEISIYIISFCDIKIIMQKTDQRILLTLECKNCNIGTLHLLLQLFLTVCLTSAFFPRN